MAANPGPSPDPTPEATTDSGPAWLAIECPRCGAAVGHPCWRTYPVLHATLRAAEVPTLGYCTARATAAAEARARADSGS